MYADRYARPAGIQPGSLIAAFGLSALMVSGLVLSSPAVKAKIDKILTISSIPLDPPPEPIPPEAKPQPLQKTVPSPKPIDAAQPIAKPAGDDFVGVPSGGTAQGTGDIRVETILPPLPPIPVPVLTDAAIDTRFASAFQPDYPAGERRAEREGRVVIRVLIGVDGRVKRAEQVSAASPAFWAATERQALSKWRFRPAARDGVPIEAWRTMTVRFEMGV